MTCNEGLGIYIKTSLLWMAPGLLTHLTLTRWNKSQKWAASQRKADRTQGRGLSRNWSNFWAPPTFFASWHFVDVSYALLACIVSKLHCIKRQYCLPLQNMILMIERNACRGRGESWKQVRGLIIQEMACWPRSTRVYKRLQEYIVYECIWMYMNSINKSPGRSCSTCSEAAMWGFPPEVHASRKMKRRKMFASWHTAHCEHLLKRSEKHYTNIYQLYR